MNKFQEYENRGNDFYARCSENYKRPLQCVPNLHAQVELVGIISGRSEIFLDSKKYIVEAGDAFICFPNQVHQFISLEKEDYILFIFPPDIIPELSRQFLTKQPASAVFRGILRGEPETLELMQKILAVHQNSQKNSALLIKGYLTVLLAKLFEKTELCDVDVGDMKIVGRIINYCSQNYNRPLSLSILEKELHISKFYISHTLGNKLRIGFNDYINSLRIINACRLLQSTDMSVTDISEEVGFNTPRTFNRAFIKYTGTTPRAYRTEKSSSTSLPV